MLLSITYVILAVFGDRQGDVWPLKDHARTLRRDWSSGQVYSKLAKQFMLTQQARGTPVAWSMNNYGMGSDIHTWGAALCRASMDGKPLVTTGSWIWDTCGTGLDCYFGPQHRLHGLRRVIQDSSGCCSPICRDLPGEEYFTAAVEYLFRLVSPGLRMEATAAAQALGLDAIQHQVTVHIRWGDKWSEARPVPIVKYVDAVHAMALRHGMSVPVVFVLSEDRTALDMFKASAPKSWTVLEYTAARSTSPRHRFGEHIAGWSPMQDARSSHGRMGFTSLVVLLLAMESNHYVLTHSSNWSNLIDRVRRGRIEAVNPGSTDVILL